MLVSPTASLPTTLVPAASRRQYPPVSTGRWWLLLLGAVLFERLFWHQRLGLNGLLFVGAAVAAQWWRRPRPIGADWPLRVATAGALLSGGLMALYGSLLAGLAGWVSLALVLAFARWPQLRSVGYALLSTLGGLWQVPPALRRALAAPGAQARTARCGWFYGQLLGLPLLALLVFHVLFALANSRYAAFSSRFVAALGQWFSWLFEAVSVVHLLFWALALLVAGAVVLQAPASAAAAADAASPDVLTRQRQRRPRVFFRSLALRKEWLAAVATLGLLNALLLLVNFIDINWLWLGSYPTTALEMKQFVHEGTYLLIFSILLAMALVLWAFRRNLNFYQPGLRALRWLASLWVVQNAVLAVSVGLRNYYFIVATGLAYRRIGVYAFLALTLFGLGTMALKIWQRRTVYSLVRLNGWATYALLLALAAGNWEVCMVRYNVQHQRLYVDLSFLLALPGRALPALHERRAVLADPRGLPLLMRRPYADVSDVDVPPAEALTHLDLRTREYLADYDTHRTWLSWTYADWQARRQLRAARPAPFR